MAGSVAFPLSSSVLRWARTSMGYSVKEAAEKMGIPDEKYESWETGESRPTYKQLENLAERVYKRPVVMLLLKDPPRETPINQDFRSLSNKETDNLSPELRLAIRRAKKYQLILEETEKVAINYRFRELKFSRVLIAKQAASAFRSFIGLSLTEQQSWKPESAFANFRGYIEALGVFVFILSFPMDEARAFCIWGNFPIIVLNQNDSKNGNVFSLFHEMCHVIFKQNDIFRDLTSKSDKSHSEIERFCNDFAAAFLVPDDAFDEEISRIASPRDTTDQVIAAWAKKYNVSNEVIARKLLSRGLISEELFWKKKRRWDSLAMRAKEYQREKRKTEEPGGFNQAIKIVYEKGKPYVSTIIRAYNAGLISLSDLSSYLETKVNHLPKILERVKM